MYVDHHPHCEAHVLSVFELYEELLRSRNQIDFDDMLWLTLQLLQSNEKLSGLLSKSLSDNIGR